ncbi:uncharacterized protein cpx isoform X2 [Dermacentor albipictus]|uniref:uncharacterized protein cpx isoform X2 n=1 Tax=Dermacentor albipictus TaxID=60249 RepID=UPI0031FCDA38
MGHEENGSVDGVYISSPLSHHQPRVYCLLTLSVALSFEVRYSATDAYYVWPANCPLCPPSCLLSFLGPWKDTASTQELPLYVVNPLVNPRLPADVTRDRRRKDGSVRSKADDGQQAQCRQRYKTLFRPVMHDFRKRIYHRTTVDLNPKESQ